MILKRLVLYCGAYWIQISMIFCQQQSFSVLGMIKEPASGLVRIHTINSKNTLTIDTAILNNNSFIFNGYIDQTETIFLRLNDSIESNMFFLDPGIQTLNLKIKDNQIVLISNSKSNGEKSHFKSFEDSLKLANIDNINYLDESEYYMKVDSFLFSIVKKNRDSYFGMYKLSSYIPWYGLKNIYLKTFNLFSKNLKKTTLGKETLSEIKIANKLVLDQYFPSSLVYNIDETKVLLSTYFKNNKYT